MNRWLMVTETAVPSRRWPWDEDIQQGHPPPVVVPMCAATGDEIVLWRPQYGGGVVAIGTIVEAVAAEDTRGALRRLLSRDGSEPEYAYQYARIEHQTLMVSAPLTADYLRSGGLNAIVAQVPTAVARRGNGAPEAVELNVSEAEWSTLTDLANGSPQPIDWPTGWHINPGEIVKQRRQVHEVYGGNTQTRIAPSAKTPNVMVFVHTDSPLGTEAPRWKEGVLHVTGNLEYGRELSGENLMMVGHINCGLALRVFQAERKGCLYLGEFKIAERNPVDRWERIERTGTNGRPREMQAPVVRLEPRDGGRALSRTGGCKTAPRIALALNHSVVVTKSRRRRRPDDPQGPEGDEASTVRKLRTILERNPDATSAISAVDDAQSVAMLIQYARRRADLSALRSLVEMPTSTEHTIQAQLQRMPWIFGGEFLSKTARRTMTAQDQLDMSLVRADGSLHGVELKTANVEKLVRHHRNHLVVGACVNEAVGQAMNYLRSLDEQRQQILADLKIDCRRASITVVIGHTSFVSANCDRDEVLETIRTYNSHLTRVNVVTYDTLIDAAERALTLTTEET